MNRKIEILKDYGSTSSFTLIEFFAVALRPNAGHAFLILEVF
jgi:hypothetical protein